MAPLEIGSACLEHVFLPNLRTASLQSLVAGGTDDPLFIFLRSHPTLERLDIFVRGRDVDLSRTLHSSLPNLKVLSCYYPEIVPSLLRPLPNGEYRPIVELDLQDSLRLREKGVSKALKLQGISSTLRNLEVHRVQKSPWGKFVHRISSCLELRRLSIREFDTKSKLTPVSRTRPSLKSITVTDLLGRGSVALTSIQALRSPQAPGNDITFTIGRKVCGTKLA